MDLNIGSLDLRSKMKILGGEREASKKPFELYVGDDSVLNDEVGKVLKRFLLGISEGK